MNSVDIWAFGPTETLFARHLDRDSETAIVRRRKQGSEAAKPTARA